MRISRNLNNLELKLFYGNPEEFFQKEFPRIKRFMIGQVPNAREFGGYFWLTGREFIGEFPEIRKPNVTAVPVAGKEEDIYADPLHKDLALGCYRLTLWVPDVKSEDISVSKAKNVLKVKAGVYEKYFSLPQEIFEIRKTYKGGVLDIMLY